MALISAFLIWLNTLFRNWSTNSDEQLPWRFWPSNEVFSGVIFSAITRDVSNRLITKVTLKRKSRQSLVPSRSKGHTITENADTRYVPWTFSLAWTENTRRSQAFRKRLGFSERLCPTQRLSGSL